MDSIGLLHKEATRPPLIYTPVQSLKQAIVHANVCRSQSLHTATSVRKEARQTAAMSGPATCPSDYHTALELAGCRGQHSRQSHRRHKQPCRLRCPRHSSHQMVSLPVWLGGEEDSGSTRCSPGTTAPGACKLRVTQPPPPPPHSSSYLNESLSTVSFASRFPYGS